MSISISFVRDLGICFSSDFYFNPLHVHKRSFTTVLQSFSRYFSMFLAQHTHISVINHIVGTKLMHERCTFEHISTLFIIVHIVHSSFVNYSYTESDPYNEYI